MSEENNELIHLTIDVVAAFVGQNNMRPEDVPALIANVHKAVSDLQLNGSTRSAGAETEKDEAPGEYSPAVTVRKSLGSRDHILSMIDGKPYKTLKRHLGQHGLTPAQYRERYNLKSDYPMVAPAYSEARKAMALQIGLGQKVGKKQTMAKGKATPDSKAFSAPLTEGAAAATPKASTKRASTTAKPGRAVAKKVAAKTPAKTPAKRGRPAKKSETGVVAAPTE
jgi:predicted transcriptional regulator